MKNKCLNCGKETNNPKFCSRSCSAKFNNRLRLPPTENHKNKISETLKNINKNKPHKLYKCKVCGKDYIFERKKTTKNVCSRECLHFYRKNKCKFLSQDTIKKLSNAGKKSAHIQSECRRSKNEIYFCELCESYFNSVMHNEPMFNGWDADIIINDIKIAVLWNGPWHYKQIKRGISVKQIQNRDNIKINEIIKCEYTPYVIVDMGSHDKLFVEKEFEKFLNYINSGV